MSFAATQIETEKLSRSVNDAYDEKVSLYLGIKLLNSTTMTIWLTLKCARGITDVCDTPGNDG